MQASFEQLMDEFVQAGTVEWIGIRPEKRAEVVSVESTMLDPVYGIQGDHYAGRSGKRQVTLLQAEHLSAVASMLGIERVMPGQLRRNIVVRGLNLLALKNKSFQLGEAILEYTGACQPCSRMETTLGFGGYNAMRGHGGITARVLHAGMVNVGDACSLIQKLSA